MSAPYNFTQAEEIYDDFEDLTDTELVIHTEEGPVKCGVMTVCISPFGEEEKNAFMEHYIETHDTMTALDQYDGDDYDVLIIASRLDDEEVIIAQSIEEYVASNGVKYNFPS